VFQRTNENSSSVVQNMTNIFDPRNFQKGNYSGKSTVGYRGDIYVSKTGTYTFCVKHPFVPSNWSCGSYSIYIDGEKKIEMIHRGYNRRDNRDREFKIHMQAGYHNFILLNEINWRGPAASAIKVEMITPSDAVKVLTCDDFFLQENSGILEGNSISASSKHQQESTEHTVSSRADLGKKFNEILMRLPAKASFKLTADFDHFSVSGSALYMTIEKSSDVVGTVTNLANTAVQVVDLATNRGRTRRYATPARRQQPRIEYRIKEKAFEPDIVSCFYQSISGQYESHAFSQYLNQPRATKIPLISPTNDKFDSVKSSLTNSTISARDIETIFKQMERGEFPICRYAVIGKFRSYSERHVKTAQRSNRINFTIYYNIIIDVEIIDRLTGKTQMRQYTVPVTNNTCWAIFGSNLRSTDELKNNRGDVFKVAAKKFMNSLTEDLSGFMSL